jgi:hypothetical protein
VYSHQWITEWLLKLLYSRCCTPTGKLWGILCRNIKAVTMYSSVGHGVEYWGSIFGRDREISPCHRFQRGVHLASYPLGVGRFFSGIKRPGRETDHSPPSSAEVRNVCGAIPPLKRKFSRRGNGLTHWQIYLCLIPDSSVGIALGYGLEDRGSRVRFLAGAGNFSLHNRVQNGSGVHPASYPMGTRGSFPGSKVAGAWSWPLTSI